MRSRVGAPLVGAAGCAAAFAGLLAAAHTIGPVARADARALDGLRTLSEHHWIWVVNNLIVHTADPQFLAPVVLALCTAGFAWGRRRQALGAAMLVACAAIATLALKAMAAHPRYEPILGSQQLAGNSFPSGHSTAAMSVAMAAVLIAPRRWRSIAALAGGAYALSVSIALMTQGWHFPSDIVGGYLVAATISMLVLAALRAGESVRGAGRVPRRGGGRRIPAPGARALEAPAAEIEIR